MTKFLVPLIGEGGGNEEYYSRLEPNYKSTVAHTKTLSSWNRAWCLAKVHRMDAYFVYRSTEFVLSKKYYIANMFNNCCRMKNVQKWSGILLGVVFGCRVFRPVMSIGKNVLQYNYFKNACVARWKNVKTAFSAESRALSLNDSNNRTCVYHTLRRNYTKIASLLNPFGCILFFENRVSKHAQTALLK